MKASSTNQSTNARVKEDNGTLTYTSYSSGQKDNGRPSNNMVTSMTSFAEDMESSSVMTSFVIHPSAVAPSMINSEIYSATNFQTDSIASKMMGSKIARGI